MDATSNLDRHDTKLFHLICPSAVGGLPLGNILTSKEDEETIAAALTLFKSIVPKDAFFGRGPDDGPKIIMTDDSDAERNAVRSSWPKAILLLCIFHLLQAFWRWLWSGDHRIWKDDRPTLYNLFKPLVFVNNDKDYEKKKKTLLRNKVCKKYKNLQSHLTNSVLPRKDEWSLAYRYENQLTTHNVNTTNYAEVSFRLTKEGQFNRIKAYNFPDLLDIVLDDSIYYVNRCIDVGNNRTSQFQYQKSRYFGKRTNIDTEKILEIDTDSNRYLVPSEDTIGKYYEVNMDLGLCECPQGMLKGPCKHKHVLAEKYQLASTDVIPNHSPHLRAFYHFLGTGESRDANWYRSLTEQDEVEDATPKTMGIFDFMKPPTAGEPSTEDDDDDANENEGGNDGDIRDEVDDEFEDEDFEEGTNVGDIREESDDEEDTDDVDDEDTDEGSDSNIGNALEQVKHEFMTAIASFSDDVLKRLENDFRCYQKPVVSFTKNIRNIGTMKTENFKTALYSFNKDMVGATKKGRKKKGRIIHIQKTAVSRRTFKARGSTSSRKGRPRKDVVIPTKRKGDPVSYCLPKQKKTKKANPHCLSNSVAANRGAEKKH